MNCGPRWSLPIFTGILLFVLGCGPGAPVSGQTGSSPYSAGVEAPPAIAVPVPVLPEIVLSKREQLFEKEIAKFEALEAGMPSPLGQVLFTGSSSIRKWNSLVEDMAPHQVINRGFGGAIVKQVSAYAPRIIYPLQPSMIVLYCGENDISNDSLSAEQPLADLKDFVTLMRHHLPGTKLLFLSMKPSPARWKWWPKFQEGNQLIKEWCQTQDGIRYLDIGGAMLLDNGEVDPSLFVKDRLHMNAKGYAIWTELVREVVSDWNGE